MKLLRRIFAPVLAIAVSAEVQQIGYLFGSGVAKVEGAASLFWWVTVGGAAAWAFQWVIERMTPRNPIVVCVGALPLIVFLSAASVGSFFTLDPANPLIAYVVEAVGVAVYTVNTVRAWFAARRTRVSIIEP